MFRRLLQLKRTDKSKNVPKLNKCLYNSDMFRQRHNFFERVERPYEFRNKNEAKV
jgi:hypothetical protein